MKRILLIVLLLASLGALAQPYHNEWIDYNKTYYKFKVAVNSLYRIPQSTLASIGISNVNADHFQLWHNGVEVPIYTSITNAPLDASGFIEFWGEMNTGKPDNELYRNPEWQLNDYYSLTTDSAAYYLTINPVGNNKRLVQTANNIAGNTLPTEQYFMHRAEQNYRAKVHGGRAELVGSSYTYSSTYDIGEGNSSTDIATGASLNYNFTNLRTYTGPGAPTPKATVYAAGNAVRARNFRVSIAGDSIGGAQMDYYDQIKYSVDFPLSKIASGTAQMSVTNQASASGDRMVVGKMAIDYPRAYVFNNITRFEFSLPANPDGNYLEMTGFPQTGSNPVLYDLTNGKRYVALSPVSPLRFRLEPSMTERKLVISSVSNAYVGTISSLTPRNFIDYSAPQNQGNYLIISNSVLTSASGSGDPVEDYRQYRSSTAGGSFNAKTYMIDQLEDQFGLGISMTPLSIRNFVHWARANFSAPVAYVLLIGKATTYNQYFNFRNNAEIDKLCLVPTFGNPASDNLLTAVRTSSIPLVPIGRLSAINKHEVSAYLNKVKEYEQLYDYTSPLVAEKGWKKNVVHVVGAGDNNTSNLLANALQGHQRIIEDTMYAANVHTFSKTTADAVEQVASVRLGKLFEEGIGVLTYFGHSSSNALEFNLDNPQAYNNPGKYPVMIVMGCNAGSFYNFTVGRLTTTETISEKFVFAENRGAIAFLASTHLGIIHYLDIYNTRMYRALSRSHYGATIGEIMGEAIRQTFALTTENDFYARFQCEQFTLHGDPALRFYNSEKTRLRHRGCNGERGS
ncbi:MAG: C25 family cysteine peptidase [Chitinophagaceae bacterium]|nr:C25 family cysteine peptidase [Chitinophagaceae bacterium]